MIAVRAVCAALLLFLAALFGTTASAAPPTAWQQLWSNRNAEARAAFRAALAANPKDGEALRALGLISLQEDSEAAALQAWSRLYKVAPTHWSAGAYWPRVVELARATGRWSLLDAAARDILAAKGVAPELRTSARLALAEAAARAGKSAEARKLRDELGFVRQWRVIGPFDNVSLSGFDKRYPPEQALDLAKSYAGKDDLSLRWHRLAVVAPDGECEVADSLSDGEPGVFYGATAISAPSDQEVALEFDPTGASKVYLNGKQVFRDELYRVARWLVATPFRVNVKLRKGWNTILVKLADEHGIASFSLRFAAVNGADLPILTADPTQVAGTGVAPEAEIAQAEPSAAVALRAELKQRPENLELASILAYTLLESDDSPGALEVLSEALRRHPEVGWLHWQRSLTLTEDGQLDEARRERALAVKHNPKLIDAQVDALTEESESLSPEELRSRAEALLKINPNSPAVHWALARAYTENELMPDAVREARAVLALGCGPSHIRSMVSFFEIYDRPADAEKALAVGLAASSTAPELLSIQAERLEQQKKRQEAIAVYQKLLAVVGPRPMYRMSIASLYENARDLKKSIQTLRVIRSQRPQDAYVCTALADALLETGSKPEAITLYREAVALNPAQVALRDKLRVLSGEQPVLKLVQASPLPQLTGKGVPPIEAPGASSVVILDEAIRVVYPDYATVTHIHFVVKVLDAAAVRRYQSLPLDISTNSAQATVENARLVKADGKIEKIDPGFSPSAISFPSLAPGDVIDVTYRIEDYQRGGLARQFWDEWYFGAAEGPCRLSRYVLVTPPDLTFQTRSHGPVPEPKVSEFKGWRIHEWRMEDVSAKSESSLSLPHQDSLTWLDISSVPSWQHVVKWYQDLSRVRCQPDANVRALAAELTRNAKTEEEKLRAMVAYVSRDIQYQTTPFRMSAFVPTAGKQVLRERYGDCKDKAALLTALLDVVGIKSEMVLLSGRSSGVTPYLPSPRFNHAIARVHTAKGPLWVDATADQLEFGGLPYEDQQVPALIINDETTDLVLSPAMPVERNRMDDRHRGQLSADGKLAANIELVTAGGWGWLMRSAMRLVPGPNRDEVLRSLIGQMIPMSRYDKGALQRLGEPDQPLGISIDYGVERYGTTAGNLLLARLPWGASTTGSLDALSEARDRKQEIDVAQFRGRYVSSVRLELPEGFTPKDLKSELKRETEYGTFRFTYRLEGRVLHGTREVTMSAFRVPAVGLEGYLAFLSALDQETKKQFIFEKKAP